MVASCVISVLLILSVVCTPVLLLCHRRHRPLGLLLSLVFTVSVMTILQGFIWRHLVRAFAGGVTVTECLLDALYPSPLIERGKERGKADVLRIVDVGGGCCNLRYTIQRCLGDDDGVELVGLETDPIPKCNRSSTYDGWHIRYPDRYFDVGFVVFVLHHIPHATCIVREMARTCHRIVIAEDVPSVLMHRLAIEVLDGLGNWDFLRIRTPTTQLMGGTAYLKTQSRTHIV